MTWLIAVVTDSFVSAAKRSIIVLFVRGNTSSFGSFALLFQTLLSFLLSSFLFFLILLHLRHKPISFLLHLSQNIFFRPTGIFFQLFLQQ
jgi:hypothetical protein